MCPKKRDKVTKKSEKNQRELTRGEDWGRNIGERR
jgi:hypothetical protein